MAKVWDEIGGYSVWYDLDTKQTGCCCKFSSVYKFALKFKAKNIQCRHIKKFMADLNNQGIGLQ